VTPESELASDRGGGRHLGAAYRRAVCAWETAYALRRELAVTSAALARADPYAAHICCHSPAPLRRDDMPRPAGRIADGQTGDCPDFRARPRCTCPSRSATAALRR